MSSELESISIGIHSQFGGIFIPVKYLTIIYEVDISVGCVLVYVCKNVRLMCPFRIMDMKAIFAMLQLYFVSNIC